MEQSVINGGVWPTMISAFTKQGVVDINATKMIAQRLEIMGSNGIFAVCQSSEMFFLNIEEKVKIARLVKETISHKTSLVVSGHTAESLNEQIDDLKRMQEVGADALVLVTNRLAGLDEGFDIFKKNTEAILDALPNSIFGLYECPYPFLRLLSDKELEWCAKTNRIRFLKDVSCNIDIQKRRVGIVTGTNLKLYNANTKTLLSSLKNGYYGYNGVMGNFHIDLYKWLYNNISHESAEDIQKKLTTLSIIEDVSYPINAKYYLSEKGYEISLFTRSKDSFFLTEVEKQKVKEQIKTEINIRNMLGLPMQK